MKVNVSPSSKTESSRPLHMFIYSFLHYSIHQSYIYTEISSQRIQSLLPVITHTSVPSQHHSLGPVLLVVYISKYTQLQHTHARLHYIRRTVPSNYHRYEYPTIQHHQKAINTKKAWFSLQAHQTLQHGQRLHTPRTSRVNLHRITLHKHLRSFLQHMIPHPCHCFPHCQRFSIAYGHIQ